MDILHTIGATRKELVSDEHLHKCWSQVMGNDLLKIHFATWFEMTRQLVLLTKACCMEKEDNKKRKEESESESDLDYGDDEEEDTGAESQDDQTQKICKRRHEAK